MCDGHVATRMFFDGFVMLCSIFLFLWTPPKFPQGLFMTYWHYYYHAVCLQDASALCFSVNPLVVMTRHQRSQKRLAHQRVWSLLKRGAKGGGLTASFCRSSCNLASKLPLWSSKKKDAFFAAKEACSKISASEMVSLKKASLRRNPAEIHQCLRVFESGLQPVRMQFRWWHVSCSWKACIAKCNRGTGTLAVSCNFCGGAVSSSGALAYFKELVK